MKRNTLRLVKGYYAILISALVISFHCSPDSSTEIIVSDFGAIPDDGKDDTPAILEALKACREHQKPVLVFGMGRYDIYPAEKNERGTYKPSIRVEEIDQLTIDGRGAEFIGHELSTMFHFTGCRNITLTNLSTDWDPLPYTQGQVVKVDTDFVDIEVVAPFTAQAGRRTEAILGYDMENKRMARRLTDHYQKGYEKLSEISGPGIMRLFIGRQDRFAGRLPSAGDYIIARHQVYNYQSLQFLECSDVRVQNVTVYCNPGMGVTGRDCHNVTLNHVNVMIRPGSGRWMACTADATNFSGCRGTVVLENCLFEGQGDDATNVRSGEYLLVDERIGDTRLKIKHGYRYTSGIPEPPRNGDIMEFSSAEKPLLAYTTAKVRSASVDENDNSIIVVFTEKLPEGVGKGNIVANASSCPALRIRNCYAVRNRARGFIVKTRDVIIEDCTMQDICASAVGLEADVNAWWEAIGTGNVIIRNNRFIRCKFEPEYLNGVIESHTMSKTTPPGVHQNIVIENNLFLGSDGNMIKLGSADNVRIINNVMDGPGDEAILLYNTNHVLVTGNKLTNSTGGLVVQDGCDPSTIRLEGNIGF
jgi:polygalacturonase